jgi:protein involved in polysaccharide export with SLBB domain
MKLEQLIALAFLSVALPTCAIAQEAASTQPRPYLLGPQDKLAVRVHSLKRNVGEAYAWTPLNGEFTVGADGRMLLPIVGPLKVAGLTATEMADQVSKGLMKVANLAELPLTSVEVIRHRPFFVIGAVLQPGKYEFQPGMTVLQAVGTAQGLARVADIFTAERNLIATDGELRTLEIERIALETQLARLTAEIAGADEIAFPDHLLKRKGNPRVAKAISEENARMASRRTALVKEVETIEQSKRLFQQELESLASKLKALDRQLEASRRETRVATDLVKRGLSPSPRQFAAENMQISVESNRLDVHVARLRAQQAITRAERDLVEIQARFRRESLDDSVKVRNLLAQNAERMRTTERLVRHAEIRAHGLHGAESVPVYRLTRTLPNGTTSSRAVSEGTRIEPGDVLHVQMLREPSAQLSD